MKVYKLIDELKRLDPELDVYYDNYGILTDVSEIEIIEDKEPEEGKPVLRLLLLYDRYVLIG